MSLADEIDWAIQANFPNVIAQARDAIMNEYDGNLDGGEKDYEYNTPISNPDLSIARPARHNDNHDQ